MGRMTIGTRMYSIDNASLDAPRVWMPHTRSLLFQRHRAALPDLEAPRPSVNSQTLLHELKCSNQAPALARVVFAARLSARIATHIIHACCGAFKEQSLAMPMSHLLIWRAPFLRSASQH